jgi:hypothetical protein
VTTSGRDVVRASTGGSADSLDSSGCASIARTFLAQSDHDAGNDFNGGVIGARWSIAE